MIRRRGGSRLRSAPLALVGLLAIAPLLGAPAARTCMICDQDKVAATYDFAVVSKAAARHHRMFFGALEGPVTPNDPSLARRITRALESDPAVDPGTVRVSLAPAAISFAWDPARITKARLLSTVRRALQPNRLGVRPIEAALPPESAGSIRPAARP